MRRSSPFLPFADAVAAALTDGAQPAVLVVVAVGAEGRNNTVNHDLEDAFVAVHDSRPGEVELAAPLALAGRTLVKGA